jgi:hypothetical protein
MGAVFPGRVCAEAHARERETESPQGTPRRQDMSSGNKTYIVVDRFTGGVGGPREHGCSRLTKVGPHAPAGGGA